MLERDFVCLVGGMLWEEKKWGGSDKSLLFS